MKRCVFLRNTPTEKIKDLHFKMGHTSFLRPMDMTRGGSSFIQPSKGKKVGFIKNNNRVCFEVDEYEKGSASV